MEQGTRPVQGSQAFTIAWIAAAYFLAATASMSIFRPDSEIICLWFANVIVVACLIRHPSFALTPSGIAIFAAALAANLVCGNPLDVALMFAGANLFGVVAGAGLVRWRGSWPADREQGVKDYAETLVLSGAIAPAVTALIVATAAHLLFAWPFGTTAWSWLAGDALSFAMLLPIFLLVSRRRIGQAFGSGGVLRLAAWIAICCGTAVLSTTAVNVPFIVAMVPLMLAAASNRPFEVAIITAVTGLGFVGAAMAGIVPSLEGSITFANGYQIAVAITIVFPFLGSLLIERVQHERRRIAESEQRFRRAMEDSAIGVAIVGLDGCIVEANKAFADLLGYERDELKGVAFATISHPDDTTVGADVVRTVLDGRSRTYTFEKRYMRKDGQAVWTRITGSVITDVETGAPLYLVSQIENIDGSRKSAAAIAEAEARWDFALASAGQGVWEIDDRKGGIRYSSTWSSMLGYADGELDGDTARWLTLIHPDDRAQVEAADRAHMAGDTPVFEAEFRMRHKSGHYLWIMDRGKVLERNAAGEVTHAIGTLTNITQRKEAEERLALSAAALADEKERLKVTLMAIGDAVICTDAQNRITFMNPVAEKLTGVRGALAVGALLETAYRSVDEETGESLAARRRTQARTAVDQNSRAVLVRADGSRCSIREVVSQIVNSRNEFCGSIIVFQDFTDARTLQRELAYAASHDALTGLANRTSFMKSMETMLAKAVRDGNEHQLVYLDLDHFKAVNDTSGHAAGDALLKHVTDMIRRTLRPGDTAARLGGDEFAIVFQGCTPALARKLAQGLVDRLKSAGFEWQGRRHQIGASAGIAPISGGAGAVDEIIARADEACYTAKAAGRGRIAAPTDQAA